MDELDALYDAAVAGDADAIAKLEVEADRLFEKEYTILHTESKKGNINRVRFILTNFANKNLLTKLTKYKFTALHWAIYQRHTEVAELLIDEARRQLSETSFQDFLRQGDQDLNTALYAAVKKGNVAIVKLLVEADPTDRHIPNKKGKTPMYKAVEKGYKYIVEIISTTCTAPSLDGPDCRIAAPIKDLDQAKSPGGTPYKIMDKDAIYAAAFAGDADAIARLERQADTLNKYGETILHIESRIGNTEHVRFILKEFASKNLLFKLCNQHETALSWAADCGHTDVVEVLIDAARHLPPSATEITLDNPIISFQDFLRNGDKDSDTALHIALMKGNLASAKLLLEADPSHRHSQNKEGETPFYIAVKKGYTGIVKFMCTTCTALSLDGPGGSTALHAAIRYLDHDIELVNLIIGAARNLPPSDDDNSVTPFQAFLRQGDQDLNTALHIAVMQDNVAIVKLLVEADPTDRHIPNNKGNTPMYIAVEKGYTDIVKVMSTTCTAPSLDGPGGSTSLHAAMRHLDHDIELVNLIIGAARNLPPSDDDNSVTPFQAFLRKGYEDLNTALHIAVMQGDLASAKLLLEADPSHRHSQNKKGETPFYIAVEKGYTDIVKVMCTTCTAPSLDGPEGSTALHAAIRHLDHDIELVKFIIGAASKFSVPPFQDFVWQPDQDLNTALHIAVMQGNLATAELLVEADPYNRHTKNNEGKTPIYIAAEKGYYHIVKMICTASTVPPHLDGPSYNTTLHIAIKNLDKAKKEEDRDVIRIIINAFKKAHIPGDSDSDKDSRIARLFYTTDENHCNILELAVEQNYADVVELILEENPAYNSPFSSDFIDLLGLIYKATEKDYKYIVRLLSEKYQSGVERTLYYRDREELISAIRNNKKETVLRMLHQSDKLVSFGDNHGWTVLHHAAYHEFDSIIETIIEAERKQEYGFSYQDWELTPFYVAAEKGYTSTVILLMKLWPSWSSSYTFVDRKRQNILHLAALQGKKKMIQGILQYCREEYKKEFVNHQDINGNTPLHILIRNGCFVPELLRYEGLDITLENNEKWTPPDMLFYENQKIIQDQVQIKITLDHIQNDHKRDIFSSAVPSSKREKKDFIFNEQAKLLIREKLTWMKEDSHDIANCFTDAIGGDAISKAALEMKADTPDEEGKTILHIESMKGETEHVRFIVLEFANKNVLGKTDKWNQTALHLAVHHGHTEVVEVLIDAARRNLPSSKNYHEAHNPLSPFQAFIRQPTGPGRNTALHIAVLNGKVDIVKLLVEADPTDRHVKNYEGKTPIYIAAENGYNGIIEVICTTRTAQSLEGPRGSTTALHAFIRNNLQVTEESTNVLKMMVNAAKHWSTTENTSLLYFEALFSAPDELGSTILQMAVERNHVDAVKLILQEDPAYQHGHEIKRNGLMRLIYKAMDDEYSDEIIKLLSHTYDAGIINPDHKDVSALIVSLKKRDEDSVLGLLGHAKHLVTFTEDNGWTPLHYAVYHEFDSVVGVIIEAQEEVGHQFVYGDMISTPFHVAVKRGYASTLLLLMQLWPVPSSASVPANSPYIVVDKDGRNLLHLAAADNRKDMVEGILKYCPEKYKDTILKQQDTNGDTPLHLLISHGCFVPELIKHKGLDTMAKNKNKFTPRDMLYFQNDVVADQVNIKIALDDVQTNKSAWNRWAKSTEKKTNIWKSIVPSSKRRIKDVIFDEHEKLLMNKKRENLKTHMEKYKNRTNTQIIVAALITTVTFTVGFTMPGGLRQSGGVDEGLVVLSRKAAFDVFMVSDALALLLSTCSLFLYFLESMYEDPHQVSKLNAASVGLNIVSVVAMMMTFITGTYLVLSHSPALAITVCLIGSFFFVFVVVMLIKLVYDHQVKRNKD